MGWFYNRLGMGKNPQGQNAVKVSQKGQLLSRRGPVLTRGCQRF
eukprot:COSAG04_NODE_14083_length_581_cov_0.970954_2_plen_44_part_00